jgi:hypothetical protein
MSVQSTNLKSNSWQIFFLRWFGLLVLGPIWFLSTLLGWNFILGLPLRNWIPEYAVLFNKLTYEVGSVGVVVLIGLSFIVVGWLTRAIMVKIRQKRSDLIATKIMHLLRTNPEARYSDFFLYLRAFETTGRLNIPLFLRLQKLGKIWGQILTNDVESYVSSIVVRIAPLIALGQPGEMNGAGRILTENKSWMKDIQLLLDRCRAILMVPSHRPGTLWEIEVIKRKELLRKCVFIMPPRSHKKNFDMRERWVAARESMDQLGLEAPEYQDSGMLFVLAPEGKVTEIEPFLLEFKQQVRKSFKRLLDDRPPKGGLNAAVARADRRRRRASWLGWLGVAYYWSAFILAAISFLLPGIPLENPNESWGLTFDRIFASFEISQNELMETVMLGSSERYRLWKDSIAVENLDEEKSQLMLRGLFRLKGEDLRDFYAAFSEMLDRLDTKTCAEITMGNIRSEDLNSAYTYMPPMRISQFIRLRAEACLAELEGRPVPAIDEKIIEQASERYFAELTRSELELWQRINLNDSTLSEEDYCWFCRTLFGGVRRLDAEHACAWARFITFRLFAESQAQ